MPEGNLSTPGTGARSAHGSQSGPQSGPQFGPQSRSRGAAGPGEAVGPDVDLHVVAQRRELWSSHRVLPAIAVGGMVGASARYAVELALPHASGAWPWATFWTNALGCFLIGILMVFVTETGRAHPLLRPFVGVGVLGGYTTFSTYAVQVTQLAEGGDPARALAYLVGTLLAALVAVTLGVASARLGVRVRRRLAVRHHETQDRHDRKGRR